MISIFRTSAKAIAFASLMLLNSTYSIAEDSATKEASSPMTENFPILIAKSFLEGKGLVPTDPNRATDKAIQTDLPISSSTHKFYEGKISAYVIDAAPGKVRIDGLPVDEFVQILEGRLILTPDEGEEMEFKKGDYLIVPEGYTGYWTMPEQYREFVIINTTPEPSE